MRHTTIEAASSSPLPPLRILVEDPALDLERGVDLPAGFEVTCCNGPAAASEVCPLVTDGRCPLGEFDVVASALDGPWAASVLAAWAVAGTPCTGTRLDGDATDDQRLVSHLGSALLALWGRRS